LQVGPFTVENITAAHEIPGLQKLHIFPNPTAGRLNVFIQLASPDRVDLSLWNGLGVKVADWSHVGSHWQLSAELGGLASGVYFLKIQVGQGVAVQRVVVE
jgi:hypothetical protein